MNLLPLLIIVELLLLISVGYGKVAKKKGKTESPSSAPSLSVSPSDAPTVEGNVLRTSTVALCRVDPMGLYIQSNNPRFLAEDTVEINTETITYEEVAATLRGVALQVEQVGEVAEGIAKFLDSSKRVVALLGIAGPFLALGISIFGPLFGLKSSTDLILESLEEGFNQLNDQLVSVQLQLRRGFLEISSLISDVTLDELSSRLDTAGRAFNDYVRSTGTSRFQLYEPRFRAICNQPFQAPEDLFYDLYGYVCESCEFATRKRADLFSIAEEQNEISATRFFETFGGFMLRSMITAMSLHASCLPPIEGSCVDRTQDSIWKDGLLRMESAFDEALARITAKVEELRNWAGNIRSGNIADFVEGGDNQDIADRIKVFIAQQQPDFNIQVIVVDEDVVLDKQNIFRSYCAPDTGECTTEREKTGHIAFDNVRGKSISIRYRLKALGEVPRDIRNNFPGRYQGHLSQLDTDDELRSLSTTQCPGMSDNFNRQKARSIFACAIPQCFKCTGAEDNEVERIIGDSFYIFRTFFIRKGIIGTQFREADNPVFRVGISDTDDQFSSFFNSCTVF